MEIIVNYDLIDRINEAKYGYSLQKCNKTALAGSAVVNLAALACHMPIEFMTVTFPAGVALAWITKKYCSLAMDEHDYALDDLDYLSSALNDLYIRTNRDLLLDSEVYQTNYNAHLGKFKLPYILETKYIGIPTLGEKSKVSVVQKHIIGNREYYLSKGAPKEKRFVKVHKFA